MKKVLVGLAGLVVVLIATVLIAPSFIDWTSYRNGIAAEIERVLGRRVMIDGAVEASIVPTPRLSLHGLRVGNLTGATSPTMAQVEALELRVAFWPLLSGKIVVTSVVLRQPVIELELLPDGQRNWVFGRSVEDVQFENATITDGTVIYRETRTGAEQRVEGINARLAADGFYGPLRAAGELRYDAIPLRFSLSTGRFDPRGQATTPVNLTAEIAGPSRGLGRGQAVRAAGSFTGTVRLPESGVPQAAGEVKLRGDDLADLLATIAPVRDVPDVLAQPFSLESALDLKESVLTANGVNLQLGETRAQGAVNAAFTSDEPQVDLTLTFGRIDLDSWLAAAAKKAAARPAEQGTAPAEAEEFELPVNLRLTLDVTADALTHRNAAARQIKLAAEMDDGVVDIYQFSVQLPGGTDATFSGKLLAADGRAQVNGLAEVASDDFRSLLAWLDMDISGLPAGRLNKVSATGHLAVTTEMLDIGELDLRFDNTRVTGALVGALRERPGFGVNLIVDQFDVDSYLPGAAAGADMTAALAAIGALPLTALTDFDANLRLRVDRLALGKTTARGVNLDGTLANGTLTMRKLAVADVAGGVIGISGTLDGFDDKVRSNVQFDVRADEPAGLLRAAGIPLPVSEDAIKPFAAEGKLSGRDAAYNIDATVNAGVASLAVKGDAAFPAGAPAKLALDLGVQHPNYIGLIRLFAPDFAPEQEPEARAVNLAMRLESRAKDYNLLNISGMFGPLTLDGNVAVTIGDGLPRVVAQLNAGDIDTRHFFAAAQPKPTPRGAPAPDAAERWSGKPLDLDFARVMNGNFSIGAKSLRHRQWTMTDTKAEFTLAGGGIELKQFDGQLGGGKLAMQGRLVPSGQSEALALNYTVSVVGAEIGPALFGGATDLSGGRFDLDLEGAAAGSSEAALVAGLNGKGLLTVENTVLKGFDLNRLNARLPFVESPGELVRLIRSSLSGGTTRVTRLQGDMTLTNGVIGIDDLRIRSPAGEVRALVAADLPHWGLDATVEVRLNSMANPPPFEMQLSGPLDAPKRDFDSDALQAYLLEEMARRPQRPAQPRPPAASAPQAAPASPPRSAPRAPDSAPGAAAGPSSAPTVSAPRQAVTPPGTPATRTTDEPLVLQRSRNAPAAANEVPRPPPVTPATPGARVLQVSPNAASPPATGPEPVEPEADSRPLGMPPAGEPMPPRQPGAPDPDAFTREILRSIEP